jgi:hypothetical protein
MVGLRDIGIIPVQTRGGGVLRSEECSIYPRGLVVRGTSLGRERESVLGL